MIASDSFSRNVGMDFSRTLGIIFSFPSRSQIFGMFFSFLSCSRIEDPKSFDCAELISWMADNLDF